MLNALLIAASEGESSKTLFYVIGGALVAWAVVLSAVGLRQPDFPGTTTAARGTMAVTSVLVLATAVAIIVTA